MDSNYMYLINLAPQYRKAQENFYKNRDVNVWLYIARAQYMWAKETQDSQHLQESLQSVQRAYLLKGDDLTILYDIALCQQAYAQMLLGTPVERLTQSAVKKACNFWKAANHRSIVWTTYQRINSFCTSARWLTNVKSLELPCCSKLSAGYKK